MISFRRLAPSLLTLCSLFCGLQSVKHSMHGTELALVVASWWILAAAVFDALDGKVSRLLKSSSEFGVEFDSIADVCSFGFAPAVLSYQFIGMYLPAWNKVGFFLGFLFLACGAIRLARFNVELVGFDKGMFKGMPIPSAAGILAAFVVFSNSRHIDVSAPWLYPWLLVVLSLLMVSNLKYDTLPRLAWDSTRNRIKLVIVLSCAVVAVLFPAETFLPLGVTYLVSGFVRALLGVVRRGPEVGSTDGGRL